jgi:hypothetical protein
MLRALGIRSTPIRPPVTGADANGLNRPQLPAAAAIMKAI